MACDLLNSFTLDCRSGVGGIEEMKFKNLPSSTTLASDYTLTSGTVTVASGSQTDWFKYNLEKQTANAINTGTGNALNGTWYYDQTILMIMNNITTAIVNEIKLMGQARSQVAVKYRNGTYRLFGYQNGVDLVTATEDSGTNFGDRNGATYNFKGMETEPAPFMSAATYDTL